MPKDDGLDEALSSVKDGFDTLYLYGGEVTLYYHDKLHAYWIEEDGTRYLVPGVTTVTDMIDKSGPLTQWAANSAVEHILTALGNPDIVEHYQREKAKLPVAIGIEGDDKVESPTTIYPADLAKILAEARMAYRNISKTATDIGHLAHEWLEGYLKYLIELQVPSLPLYEHAYEKESPKPEDPKAVNAVNAALAWLHKHKYKPLASERKIYSREYNYSGTEDFEGILTACGDHTCCPYLGEVYTICDFKTSKALYDTYRLQLAAYHQARTEEDPEFGDQVGARIILRIGKDDGEFETMVVTQAQFDMDLDGFLACLSMYNWAKQHDLIKRGVKADAKVLKAKAKKPKKPSKVIVPKSLAPAEEVITIEAA